MQKTFLQNLFLLIMLNLLVKPFWLFGIDRTVQNVVGTEQFGIYYALLNFSFLLNVLLDPGINTFNNRNIARHSHLLSKYVSSIVMFKLLLSGVYFTAILTVAYLLGYSGFSIHLLTFLALNQVLASMLLYLRSNLSGLHLFRTDSLLSVLDRFLMILICSVLLWGGVMNTAFRIEWFVYAQTLSYGIAMLLAAALVFAKTTFFRPRFNMPFFLVIFKKSYPFALLTILITLYSKIDSVMLERLLPDGDFHAGIYAAGFRILEALTLIAFLFGSLLLPIFSRLLMKKEPVLALTLTAFRLLVIMAILISLSCFFYRHELMDWLYVEESSLKGSAFGIMVFSFIATSIIFIFGSLLTANHNIKQLSIISAFGLGLNILINLILIPRWEVFGAVTATVSTQFLVALLHGFLLLLIFKKRLPTALILKILLLVCISTTFLWFFVGTLEQWQFELLILTVINIIFALLLGLLKPGQIYQILKSKEA